MDTSQILCLSAYGLVLLTLCGYGLHRLHLLFLFFRSATVESAPKALAANSLPRVTVQLPIYNERNVVDRLLEATGAMRYPSDLLEIQVLDDSTDETRLLCAKGVARLSAQGLNVRHLLRENREGFKAGALAAGLAEATGEFILILDADFVPPTDLLLQLLPHFSRSDIGMVQARWGHLNRRRNLLTRIQAVFLDGHLCLEQVARFRSGRFFNFNGTAGIWRRSCIEDAGGWAMDNLTEDLDLSYRAQLAGWRFVFLPDLVVPGELPEEMAGFKSQQHRWAKGSIQTLRKTFWPMWRSSLPLKVKLEGMAHLGANLAYLLVFALCLLTYPVLNALSSFEGWRRLLYLDLPVLLMATGSVSVFYMISQGLQSRRAFWRLIPLLPLILAVGVGLAVNNGLAVLEALFGLRSPFVRTPKRGEGKRTYRSRFSWGIVLEFVLALYVLGMAVAALRQGYWGSLPFLLLILVGLLYIPLSCLYSFRSIGGRDG